MTRLKQGLLGAVHRLFARSALLSHATVKIRNQCNSILRARLSDGRLLQENGEALLIRICGPHVRFFVDVGANVGEWSGLLLRHMPAEGRGLLFEPSPDAVSEMRARMGAAQSRIEIVQAAVDHKPGELLFYTEPQAGESSSAVKGFSRNAKEIRVSCTTLDEELRRRAIDYVDLLKIDAEGFDSRVLKGARNLLAEGRIGIVQFEYNAPWAGAGSTLTETLDYLRDCGYVTRLLKRDGLHDLDLRKYGEYFAYSNYVASSPAWESRLNPITSRRGL